jgi:small subunit ribosomal protein S19e
MRNIFLSFPERKPEKFKKLEVNNLANVKDVPAQIMIAEIAKDLKTNKKVKMPEFAEYVKTGCSRERAPQDADWWYIRMASILRKVAINNKTTVNSLRTYYGGKKNRGVKPEEFRKAGGKIIRVCLQDLEKLGLVSKSEEKKGRIITPAGQSYLDKIADNILKDYSKYKIVKKEKDIAMTKDTKEKSVFDVAEKKGKKDNKKKQEVEE